MEKKNTPKKSSAVNGKTNSAKNDNRLSEQLRFEVWGTVLIAVGLLLALSVYVISSSALGAAVSSFILGITGIFGYIVPLLFVYAGILCFLHSRLIIEPEVHIMAGIFAFLILSLININTLDAGLSYPQYLSSAYTEATTDVFRGGFLSAVITYPLIKLVTRAGANIVVIAAMVIMLIVSFRISIADMFSELHNLCAEKAEAARERRRLRAAEKADEDYPDYNDSFDDDDDYDVPDFSDGTDEPFGEGFSFPDDDLTFDNEGGGKGGNDDGSIVNEPEEDDYVQPDDMGLSDDGVLSQTEYQRPPLSILTKNTANIVADREEAEKQGRALIEALANFRIQVTVSHISIGPTVTRFEIQPAKGVRISSITNLQKDIALALAATSLRIEAPIPGKQAVGIEVPNRQPAYVYLRDLLECDEFTKSKSVLTVAVGKDIIGNNVVADISKMPHLLIAGSTGMGKSVCMNTIIMSIVYKTSPDDVKMILIDPKIVEFAIYQNLPHLLIPVVTDVKKATAALKWAVSEMARRYSLFAKRSFRNIADYNKSLPEGERRVPRIVIVIDELAELMMSSAKGVEEHIARIAQLGRACGIHLIIATQRPSVDIITGNIKANIVSRIAFAVSDATNSKVILDTTGAEFLIGNGDMLFHPIGMPKPRRVQGAFVSNEEVAAVMNFFEEHEMYPLFDEFIDSQILAGVTVEKEAEAVDEERDSMFVDAGRLVIETQRPSASFIQQRLRVGYNRAARILSSLEQNGVVALTDPVKREHKVVMTLDEFERKFVYGDADNGAV